MPEPSLVDRLKGQLMSQYYKRTDYLIARGCQICAQPAVYIAGGPTLTLTLREVGSDGMSLELTETIVIRCAEHAPTQEPT